MNKINIKLIKKFLMSIKIFFLKIFCKFNYIFKILGFFFDLRGKIGVSGSAKKRNFFFSLNSYSLVKKSNKIIFKKINIFNIVGSLGLTLILIF